MKLIAVIFLMSLSSVLAGLKGARPESDIGKSFGKDLMPGNIKRDFFELK